MVDTNRFTQNEFIAIHSRKFAKEAVTQFDVCRPIHNINLYNIFYIKSERILQLRSKQLTIIRPKEKIMIFEHLDGFISLCVRPVRLEFVGIEACSIKPEKPKIYSNYYHKSLPDHPWRRADFHTKSFKKWRLLIV